MEHRYGTVKESVLMDPARYQESLGAGRNEKSPVERQRQTCARSFPRPVRGDSTSNSIRSFCRFFALLNGAILTPIRVVVALAPSWTTPLWWETKVGNRCWASSRASTGKAK